MSYVNGYDFMLSLKTVIDFYDEELTTKKIIPTTPKLLLITVAAITTLISGFILIFVGMAQKNALLCFFASVIFFFTYVFMRKTLKIRHRLINAHFQNPSMRQYLNLKVNALASYEDNVLLAYRADRMTIKLQQENLHNEKCISALIAHLENKSGINKNSKWLPIGMTGLFLFALWSEYVGKVLDLESIVYLFFLGLLISLFIVLLNMAIRVFIWAEAEKLQEIATLLKISLLSL